MAAGHGSGIRPWAWILLGSIAMVVGAVAGLVALDAATEPQEISGLPTCRVDFGEECLTEREAVVVRRGYVRRDWLSREQKWYADVPEGAPSLEAQERLELVIPRQPGRQEVAPGVRVQVVFYEGRAAAVRTPSGRELETEEHPRRYAPTMGYFGLFGLGAGAMAVMSGWDTGRRHGFWRKTSRSRIRLGAASVLATAAMVGALAQILLGSSRWHGVGGAVAGAALGVWAAALGRRQRRTEAHP